MKARRPAKRPAVKSRIVRNRSVAEPSHKHEYAIARLVVSGPTPETAAAGEAAILDTLGPLWPTGARAKFLITPGGFVDAPWPKTWSGRTGWATPRRDLEPLVEAAQKFLEGVVTPAVWKAATGKIEVLTVGVDLNLNPENPTATPHVELVGVFDVATRTLVRWTGKSYSVIAQEPMLVHVQDLASHYLEIAGERVLVLGCHDLNLFSPRALANQSPSGARRLRTDEMRERAEVFRPTIVLQHPHTTDTPRIWSTAWSDLRRLPGLKSWASGICFWNPQGPMRAPLTEVLARTSGGSPTLDIQLNPLELGLGCRIFHVDQWKEGKLVEFDEGSNKLVGFVYDLETALAPDGSPTEGWELPLTPQEVATLYPAEESIEP